MLAPVRDAVLEAGDMIRAEWHRPGGRRTGNGRDKAPIDTEVEIFLRQRLLALHACDWEGEELARSLTGNRDRWVVDPQDGTSAFIRGHRGSAVSVALVRDDRCVLAVVHSPTAPGDRGDIFDWAEGSEAFRNGKPLPRLADAAFGAGSVVAMNERAGDFARHNHGVLAPAGILAVPSIAWRLVLAAAGEADVAIGLTPGLQPHDVSAGLALVEAVGGKAVQANGQPFVLRAGSFFTGCVAGAPSQVDAVLDRMPRLGASASIPRRPALPRRRCPDGALLSRAQGALLGQFAGDALGAQVEFQSPGEIRKAWPDGVRSLRAGGTWNLLAGQVTDDSEMALALARTLVAKGDFDERAVGEAYVDWLGSHPFDIGMTTRTGIRALQGLGQPNGASQANGALMRVSPIGIAAGHPNRAASWGARDAALTHPHPVCQAASAAQAAAIATGVAGGDASAMHEAAVAAAGRFGASPIVTVLMEAKEQGVDDALVNSGWVLIALRNAFHRLLRGESLEEALVGTVMMGGDTDTNAAICGALLGSLQGHDAIPLAWRRQVLGCRAVEGAGAAHPRRSTFWTDDALDLAEALLLVSL
ncbi:ADP-ribosylglycohydrolase family protein [Cereibacter sphaeroides]|uniref:inositol monophosphatase family protein n=1 Tax=Cereibacter sphaeroides TaxID=1063 RepID=UPI001F228C82|nr:inositol monophosphatase family protein [Cereibacter sphaeroides]MCE6958799.1 ADP-ribosylglycohydrolase family protein [Cereibacter sphaeroides]MCE6973327.1 ADP-ribosylglycohydrolase family protein [Cereibacter sphaeroides]